MESKFAFLLCSCWLLAALVCGQEAQLEQDDVSKVEIKARITEIESTQGLEESQKVKLLELYHQALARLETTARHNSDAEAYRVSVEQAPLEAEEIRRQLEGESAPSLESLVPQGAAVKDLESLLAKEQVKQADIRSRSFELETQLKAEQDRPSQLQQQVALTQQKLEAIKKNLEAAPQADEDPRISEAKKINLEARRGARIAEIRMLEQEQLSRPARLDLLSGKNDLAKLQLEQADARVLHLQEALNERRREEAEQVREVTEQAAQDALDKDPPISDLARQNAKLGRTLSEMITDTEEVIRHIQSSTEQLKHVEDDYTTTQDQLERVGLNQVLSKVLMNQRNKLPDKNYFQKKDRERRERISEGDVSLILVEDELSGLEDLDAAVEREMEEVDEGIPSDKRESIRDEVKLLLVARAELLVKLRGAYDNLLGELGMLDTKERELRAKTKDYAVFLDEKLLWIASVSEISSDTITELGNAVAWLASWGSWYETLVVLGIEAGNEAVWSVFVVLAFIALIALRRKFRLVLDATSKKVGKVHHDSYFLTINALMATLLMALPWILLFSYSSWLLLKNVDASEFARAVGAGLKDLAVVLSLFLVLYHLCRSGGVAIAHFKWPEEPVRLLRRSLWGLLGVLLPAAFLMAVMEDQGDEKHMQSLGRLAFIVAMLALSLFFYRILKARGGVTESYLRSHPEGWVARLRFLWYPAAVGYPLALAVLSGLGFYYAAKQLSSDLFQTIFFLTLALVLYDLVMRWILVAQRRLALAKARERRKAEQAESSDAEGGPAIPPVALDEREMDATTISTQSRHLVRVITGFAVIVGLWLIWEDVLPALGILDEVKLWYYSFQDAEGLQVEHVTLTHLLLALLIAIMTLVATRNIPGVLEIVILRRLPLDSGSRYAITTICRYLIVGVGIVVTFSMLGMRWSKLQWLVAALSVGLGFGLQEIFANFVSGIIILFERPVRVGDTVTVNGVDGTVSRIRIRATTITDWDQKELIIPNKNFITGDLINWTLSDPIMRLRLPVGIAYGSDTALARDLLLELAEAESMVLDDPAPRAVFLAFGESSLDFELRVYIRDISNFLNTRHNLNMAIDQAFRKHGVEIAFPQRDLHVRSVDRPMPITQVPYEKEKN